MWSKLPPEERTAPAILKALDFDFFELLDSVTIARSRKHIETFYDTKDIGKFPERRKPLSFHGHREVWIKGLCRPRRLSDYHQKRCNGDE